MSRSYKKAVYTDYSRKYTKWAKRQASKAVRRRANLANGGHYKRAFCSYDIFDFIYDGRFDRCDPTRGAKRTRAGWLIPK